MKIKGLLLCFSPKLADVMVTVDRRATMLREVSMYLAFQEAKDVF